MPKCPADRAGPGILTTREGVSPRRQGLISGTNFSLQPLTGRRPRTGASRLSPRPGPSQPRGTYCLHSDDPTASFGTRTALLQLASTDRSVRRRPIPLGCVFSRELVPTKSSVTAQFPLMRAEVVRRKRGERPAPVRVPARKRRGMQIKVAL